MAQGNVRILDADGRELRVSSGDRVIFPAAERTREVTKLEVVEYFLAVEDGIMRALRNRPTTLERGPKGVHEGMTLSTHGKATRATPLTRSEFRRGPRLRGNRTDRVSLGLARRRDLPD